MSTNHILHGRYNHLLYPLKSVAHASDALYQRGFISSSEKSEIQATSTEEGKRNALCDILTAKRVSSLLEISEVLNHQHQKQFSGSGVNAVVVTTSSSSTSDSSTETSASSSEGGTGGGEGWVSQADANFHQGNRGNVYESSEASKVNNKFAEPSDIRDRESLHPEQGIPQSQLGLPIDGKHMTTDVPDPPVELLSAQPAKSAYVEPHQGMEDAFVVLFFTLITQQLQLLWSRKPQNHDEMDQPGNPSVFPWLQLDVTSDEARDYFFTEMVKSVTPSLENPVNLKVSVILEAFQQFMRGFENIKHENLSLQRKGRMYDELVRKFRALESKMSQMRQSDVCGHSNVTPPWNAMLPEVTANSGTNAALGRRGHASATPSWNAAPPQVPTSSGNSAAVLRPTPTWNALPNQMPASSDINIATQGKVAELEEQVRLAKPLQQAYARSEERCLQLVEVTQQWAIECEEKVKVIKLLEKEADQLKVTVQQLEARVAKYKKYWVETKDLPMTGKVNDDQFQELRTELAMRRELYDQVLAQKEEALQKVKVLMSEMESLKDHNVQLVDRAANFKVQAQAKEPSVREMSNLLEQKGRLEQEVERLRKNNSELSDKTVALEILVEDLKCQVNELQGAPSKHLQPQPRRADAMVIGHNPPPHFTPNPAPTHIRAPQGSRFLSPLKNSSHHNYRKSSSVEDDDVLSLESSDAGSGNFSSHDSTSEKKRPFMRSYSGNTSPTHKVPMPQLKSREPLSDSQLGSCDVPPGSHDATPQSRDLEMAPSPAPFGSDDYTSKIRYPNNSRILVQPLLDEDISLKGPSSAGGLKVRESPSKEPFFCDQSHFDYQQPPHRPQQRKQAPAPNQPTAILPPNSPFFTPTTVERKCRVCQHIFFTLSETEFDAHVAVCSK